MDDNERKEIFDRFVAILNQSGLGWIVEQVNEQIHIGKTIFNVEVDTVRRPKATEVTVFGLEPDATTSELRRGPKAEFPTTIEYNERERLTLLLDGIAQAKNALEMEDKVLADINTFGFLGELVFYSEESGVTDRIMSPDAVAARRQPLSQFVELINRLRRRSRKIDSRSKSPTGNRGGN